MRSFYYQSIQNGSLTSKSKFGVTIVVYNNLIYKIFVKKEGGCFDFVMNDFQFKRKTFNTSSLQKNRVL